MKRIYQVLFVLLALNFAVFSGCGDDDEPQSPADDVFDVVLDQMTSKGYDLDAMLDNWLVEQPTMAELDNFLSTYYIIDLRGEAYYNNGHIEGAVTTTLQRLLEFVEDAVIDKPILLVDQTGQNSAAGMVGLRMSGFPDTKILEWGMAGWNNEFTVPWMNNIADLVPPQSNNWIAAPGDIAASEETFDPPYVSSRDQHTNPDSILAERVGSAFYVSDILNKTLLNLPAPYFINAYMESGDIQKYGNILGSHRIVPLSIADGSIYKIDAKKNVVMYSTAGLESSVVTAWLRILGYDCETLLFGLNGMVHSALDEDVKYVAPTVDLPYISE